MENFTSANSDETKNAAKVFRCITRQHNFCINEGNISINNSEDGESVFMHSNVDESGIVGSSVLRNMILQELVNRRLERPAFE